MIKALIFDFGGMLFPTQPYLKNTTPDEDTFRFIKQLVIEIFNEHEEAIKDKTYTKKAFENDVWLKSEEVLATEEITAIIQSILNVDPHMLALVKAAHENYKVYALVNEAPKWTELRVYFNDFEKYFDGFFISSYMGVQKPDPRIYKMLLEKTGLNANECAYIDNDPKNVEVAKSLGFESFDYANVN